MAHACSARDQAAYHGTPCRPGALQKAIVPVILLKMVTEAVLLLDGDNGSSIGGQPLLLRLPRCSDAEPAPNTLTDLHGAGVRWSVGARCARHRPLELEGQAHSGPRKQEFLPAAAQYGSPPAGAGRRN